MRVWIVMLVGLSLALFGCKTEQQQAVKLETLQQKVSYSVGLDIAKNFKENNFELDSGLVLRGIKDVQSDTEPQLSDEQMAEAMMEFQKYMMEEYQKRIARQTEENSGKGGAFLADNAMKEGVVALESGLQYKVLESGSGAVPQLSDVVRVDYSGTLIDGTEFDSSYKRGEPVEFPVSGVIAGWTEALQLMKEGDKWQLFIPSELAYGERGMGNVIEPNSVLVFEVALHKVLGGEELAPAAASTEIPEEASVKTE
ncbi:MAG: FKBP-type peptidyl-prolyl cis-trans isomerase [Desulfuromonas sp.]|nr:FKBP-type peptidyl-prolyl cis-trans isomerase [Desulfuromonas sp.]